ncbi:MAG: hypothetical protein ABR499_18000 [Gemmatimonadaceae bacterium]
MLKTLRDRFPTLAALVAFLAFTVLVAAAGCSSTPTGVAELAGRYELRSVDRRALPDDRLGGAIAGELVLITSGRATRTVQYATSGVLGPFVHQLSGTYRVRGTTITLVLAPEGSPASRRAFRGEADPPTIVFRYLGPTDAIVEELYVRVTP